jgi:hypothetical protein
MCKECSDPYKISIRLWLTHHRQSDKKYNRYDANHFVDTDFLKGLIEDYENCYYDDCCVDLQYIENNDSLATLERINNNIGHIKSNCVLCCLKCNLAKKSNLTTV